MIYCVDIDGTLCYWNGHHYSEHIPRQDVIAKVNRLFEGGHEIIIFSGRGTRTGTDWRKFTEEQLKDWGVKYHALIFGKPHADFFVDDLGVNVEDWLDDTCGC